MHNEATAPPPAGRRSNARHVADHAKRLSAWQVGLLLGFLALGIVGAVCYFSAAAARPKPPTVAGTGLGPMAPAGSSGFLEKTIGPRDTTAEPASQVTQDSWTAWGGQNGAALGFGFAGGFVIGFVFRAFIKLMTLITVLVGGGLAALSYYHILNVDMTAAKHAYDTNAAWINDQAMKLKDVLVAHLPSSSAGTAGLFFGLRRK